MIYLDANVVIASVAHITGHSERVARLLRTPQTFFVSRLADYEARKFLTRLADPDMEDGLNQLLANKFTLGKEWEGAILQALKIARQLKDRLWVDSADTLHVGWALSIGAEVFASFDRESGPRALAMSVGLKVWPDPTAKDFEKRKLFKS